jgi:hypothetical protein
MSQDKYFILRNGRKDYLINSLYVTVIDIQSNGNWRIWTSDGNDFEGRYLLPYGDDEFQLDARECELKHFLGLFGDDDEGKE